MMAKHVYWNLLILFLIFAYSAQCTSRLRREQFCECNENQSVLAVHRLFSAAPITSVIATRKHKIVMEAEFDSTVNPADQCTCVTMGGQVDLLFLYTSDNGLFRIKLDPFKRFLWKMGSPISISEDELAKGCIRGCSSVHKLNEG